MGGKLGFAALKASTLCEFAWDAGNHLGAAGACAALGPLPVWWSFVGA